MPNRNLLFEAAAFLQQLHRKGWGEGGAGGRGRGGSFHVAPEPKLAPSGCPAARPFWGTPLCLSMVHPGELRACHAPASVLSMICGVRREDGKCITQARAH